MEQDVQRGCCRRVGARQGLRRLPWAGAAAGWGLAGEGRPVRSAPYRQQRAAKSSGEQHPHRLSAQA